MKHGSSVFAIDAGNTSIKVALFVNGQLETVRRFDVAASADLGEWLDAQAHEAIVLSSVLTAEKTEELFGARMPVFQISLASKLPLSVHYSSPSLGMDRLCNAAYVHAHIQTQHAVSIDIGTCIKFDLVHRENGYLGGSISPGIDLRFRALHTDTGNLPLLSNKTPLALVGNSTETSMRSGVMNGIAAEIQGMIDRYTGEYPDLTFFVTGGNAGIFEFHSKNNIFADENLTLKGLFEIYKHNA
ncbi:MAG: hypothetical protein A3D92_15875 [Bacteroidetes bacterium RIFCSPHIGHO2_02_FULL_44_7]|nr:MAG: hypothetical protein A3D92_15875 [Bacteroidetes bacterium RIFCSPHIGHO2_02_FULL_44_7]